MVCKALKKLAGTGMTIALVLHQPRYEIFAEFDDLLLLGKGGRTVYAGPTMQALPYLEQTVGLKCPDRTNPADFLLDVVGGDMPLEWRVNHPTWTPAAAT
jgi:ABC-type multidrug transport system ATPase subunit